MPISELGVVSDNPSSAEAIYAAKEPLVIDAQNLNADNGEALVNVPAMPSIVSQADAITKMIGAMPWLGESDVALEEYGFTDDQIQRLRSDRARSQGRETVRQVMGGGDA